MAKTTKRQPAVKPEVLVEPAVVDPKQAVREQLQTAGLDQEEMVLLDQQKLLNPVLLRKSSADQLRQIGLALGSAMLVKESYPSATEEKPTAPTAPATAPVVQPVTPVVHVHQAVPIRDQSAIELLKLLADDPGNEEAYTALQAKPEYMKALNKTVKPIVTDKVTRKLLVASTQRYWQTLARVKPRRRFDGNPTTTLDHALGRMEKILKHPFYKKSWIFFGLDQWDINWSNVDHERMEAILWARETGHEFFVPEPNPFKAHQALAAVDLDEPWETILEDYVQWVEDAGSSYRLVDTEENVTAQSDTQEIPVAPATGQFPGIRRTQ